MKPKPIKNKSNRKDKNVKGFSIFDFEARSEEQRSNVKFLEIYC